MDTSLIQILITAGATVIVAAITSLLSLQAFRVQDKRQRAKDDIDKAAALNDMAIELLAPIQSALAEARKEIAALKADKDKLIERLDDLEFENGNLKRWAEKLVCQVQELGGTPVKFEEKTRPR